MNPQVVLLAAGKSSRAWPITEKTLVTFLGKTVIEHQINTLLAAGLTDICIVGNKQNLPEFQKICAGIKTGNFRFATQSNLNDGQRGGILAAETEINMEKPLLVVCSNDIVENQVFKDVIAAAEKSPADIFMVGKYMDNYFPGGYLSLSADKNSPNQIVGIIEKPTPGTEPSKLVNLLIHLHQHPQALFTQLKTITFDDRYEELLQDLFDRGTHAEAVEYKGFWQAIKYPWHLLSLNEYFLNTLNGQVIHPAASVAKTAIVSGPVYIEAGARIFDYAVISGPVYIGKDAVVANHALVRHSHVGARSVVGHTTEIARSLLQDDCWTHQNYVGDSIFDTNVSLGAGARTGNVRLDEGEIFSVIKENKVGTERTKFGCVVGKNVRIGVNASIMPGVKIGKDSFLGSGGVYNQDVAEKLFTFPTTELCSRPNSKSAPLRESFKR